MSSSTSRRRTGRSGGAVVADDPSRIIDTRCRRRLLSGQSRQIDLDSTPAAAIVNLTAVDPTGRGFLTLYPCGAGIPTVSNLNVVGGAVVANRALVSTGGSSHFCVYSNVDTDVVIDIEGTIAPT